MKKVFIIGFGWLLLMGCLSNGNVLSQEFDWIKTLHGASSAAIKSMEKDSDGNLYVLGYASLDMLFDSTVIKPLASGGMEEVLCPMKLSPNGDVLWNKWIYGHSSVNPSYHIKVQNMNLLDDTSLLLIVNTHFPDKPRNWMWDSIFLIDTVLFSEDTGFLPAHFFDSVARNTVICGFVKISAETGTMQGMHTLEYVFVDSSGVLFPRNNSGRLLAKFPYFSKVETKGINGVLCVCPMSNFYDNLDRNNVRGVCFIINNDKRFEIPMLSIGDRGNSLLLKFSSDGDSIVAYKYIFENAWKDYECTIEDMKFDSDGNVYVAMSVKAQSSSLPLRLTLNGGDSAFFDMYHNHESLLIKYDTAFSIQWFKQYRYQNEEMSGYGDMETYFHRIAIDEDSNAVFVMGYAGGNSGHSFHGIMDNTVLELYRGVTLLRFTMGDGNLTASGKAEFVPATGEELLSFRVLMADGKIEAYSGRIFSMLCFDKKIQLGDSIIYTPDTTLHGYDEGIAIWDYSCNAIYFVDFKRNVQQVGSGRFLVCGDSSLVFVQNFGAGEYSWFGDSCVMASDDIGVIARYVDPAFAVPYGHQPPVAVQEVDNTAQGIKIYPNPTTDMVKIEAGADEIVSLEVYDVYGRQQKSVGYNTYISLGKLPAGVYIIKAILDGGLVDYYKIIKK